MDTTLFLAIDQTGIILSEEGEEEGDGVLLLGGLLSGDSNVTLCIAAFRRHRCHYWNWSSPRSKVSFAAEVGHTTTGSSRLWLRVPKMYRRRDILVVLIAVPAPSNWTNIKNVRPCHALAQCLR